MKKSVNIAGIAFLVILFIGIIFKRLHYPGAGILATSGIFLFIVVYLPAFLVSVSRQMKSEGSPVFKLLLYLGSPGIVFLTFGILAKIMHWPGASVGLWGGIGLVSFVLLLYLVINRKANEKISMISVLIVIILLGSFSFNMFRSGNMRPMEDAYVINGSAFSECSRIFWQECEDLISEKVIPDTTFLTPPIRNELMQLHSLTQETDLIIGNMIEKMRVAENSVINIKSPGQRADMMSESLSGILKGEKGLPAMDKKVTEYKNFINSLKDINSEEKVRLVTNLSYLFDFQDQGLLFKYLGVYNLVPDVCENTLMLWKSKIWETEYRIITLELKK
jgi:hypothetical protein